MVIGDNTIYYTILQYRYYRKQYCHLFLKANYK